VKACDALSYFCYFVANDVSARDCNFYVLSRWVNPLTFSWTIRLWIVNEAMKVPDPSNLDFVVSSMIEF